MVGVFKDVLAPNVKSKTAMAPTRMLPEAAHLGFEPVSLDIKVKKDMTLRDLNPALQALVQ